MVTPTEDTNIENSNIIDDIGAKVKDASNILVALSSDPSVDELSAAIGLSVAIDGMGKHATAIYSGTTPNAIEFLNPKKAFEASPDSLQDFIIAIDKEKADHLRYKIDGEFVKIYITPYHSKINQDDLEFSYGDFNVDLVLALNVSNGIDLDSALREHGRIMHDATVVNITTGRPGKLGEIEWSDPGSSSISEMAAELVYSLDTISKEEATAFLTGIVAATDRFANARTTSHAFEIASRLMTSGADQQLIAENITSNLDNMMTQSSTITKSSLTEDRPSATDASESSDQTKLSIRHDESDNAVSESRPKESSEPESLESPEQPKPPKQPERSEQPEPAKPTIKFNKPKIESAPALDESPKTGPRGSIISPNELDDAKEEKAGIPKPGVISYDRKETTISPSLSSVSSSKSPQFTSDSTSKSASPAPINSTPVNFAPINPISSSSAPANPATASTPQTSAAPEVNPIPDINYMPMPGDEILPPPPTPPVDFSSPLTVASSSVPNSLPPTPPALRQPSSESNNSVKSSPNSFQIPNL